MNFITIVNFLVWIILFNTAAKAGEMHSPFLLISTIIAAWFALKMFPLGFRKNK